MALLSLVDRMSTLSGEANGGSISDSLQFLLGVDAEDAQELAQLAREVALDRVPSMVLHGTPERAAWFLAVLLTGVELGVAAEQEKRRSFA